MAAGNQYSYESDQFDEQLRKLAANLYEEWRWIAGFIVLTLIFAGLYLANSPALYRTDALLQLVEKQSDFSGLNELSNALVGGNSAEAEIQITKSR